ncbi:MAG: T9SS type A sorting domain-containing protein [Flavobacteriaceae bacterium]|nr:T9SS type A sorting domain-containing protein [Flavobacteriaceae bacterium]
MYTLQGNNNLYFSSENGAATGMTCNRTIPQGWEYFNWGVTGSIAVLSVDPIDNDKIFFKIYPNPANDSIIVRSLNYEPLSITVYDIYGRLILKTSTDGNNKSVDVNKIPTGIYLMNINSSNATGTVKFLKN